MVQFRTYLNDNLQGDDLSLLCRRYQQIIIYVISGFFSFVSLYNWLVIFWFLLDYIQYKNIDVWKKWMNVSL